MRQHAAPSAVSRTHVDRLLCPPKSLSISRSSCHSRKFNKFSSNKFATVCKVGTENPATTPTPKKGRLAVRVSPKSEKAIREGHPWVYSNSVTQVSQEGTAGQLAVIFDKRKRFLAVGLYDPESPLRVRVLHQGAPLAIDADFWRMKVEEAVQKRKPLFDNTTNGHRWINGEGDGFPGLVVDRYDDSLVMKVYTAAWLPHLEEVVAAVAGALAPTSIVLRLSRNCQDVAQKEFQLSDGQMLLGAPVTAPVPFLENGIIFEADVISGQKTGFFLDQRDNRKRVEEMARGARVLNAFSFSGGFSVYAARGGATHVTSLDMSQHALESADRIFQLNSKTAAIAACEHQTVKAEAFKWLSDNIVRYDVVILDPPCLAKRRTEKDSALKAYFKLTTLGVKNISAGGGC
eukprot:CAMPEP_0198228282 /NCGR_PEP_ID=MMETSP1445-20131203/112639_1 /TAXON_ID=36898 /ORGANISM="Pyramimonas sp., Strain CCMP2087" /LENGTH=402 /DNA_ID=CAMNT_0043908599 /DNA_START=106 /DNA_END=1314 /DNA_ORIENTATION=-